MIRYLVRIKDAAAHLFEVRIAFEIGALEHVDLQLASWIPGSYMIREFARNVGAVQAKHVYSNQSLPIKKITKNTWRVQLNSTELDAAKKAALRTRNNRVEIEYEVYAWDFSVRAAHLDQHHGFFNPTSLCLAILGQTHVPCLLELEKPSGTRGATLISNEKSHGAEHFDTWKVATTMPHAKVDRHGWGRYQALNFDELIDHPVEMGDFQEVKFFVLGVPHRAVFTGDCKVDLARIAQDLTKICEAQIRFFEPISGRAPFDEYLFMTHVSTDGYGGLEHRSSTALHCGRDDLPYVGMKETTPAYRKFLGLCSHEYFHAWNVKRIKPASFTPYDLDQENYTSLLWIFEGFTSYYDDLFLLRAGCITLEEYLDFLAKTITSVVDQPGRLKQSVAQSSFDSWIKYYRQDENSPNSLISYYTKGSLVALCLDLSIRIRTAHKYSLDDVMRALWSLGHGLGEHEFPSIVKQSTGCDLADDIQAWAYGTNELPLKQLLEAVGYSCLTKYEAAPDLGLKLTTRGSEFFISVVFSNRPGHLAGLSAQDIVVAFDGLRLNETGLKNLLGRKQVGDTIKISFFRQDSLHECCLTLGEPRPSGHRIEAITKSELSS
jgi:predicted metalloprotease with PDZ domain